MKAPFFLLAVVMLAGLPSCDKARDLTKKLGKKPPSATAAAAAPYTGALVSEITKDEFDRFSKQAGRVVLIDFYADWCGPCRQLAPILEKLAMEKNGLVLVGKVNVDKSPSLASANGVQSIPDVRIFRDGKQVDRFVGLPGEAEVRRRIEKQLEGLSLPPAETPDPAKPKTAEPITQPMSKDWLPPGMQRR